eukprot:CAMPEP_0176231924 /NCGR_PEP_ID=MMETSP0121_2-20121125/25048_1 /TAXON_ID=160619 /ORGANISM="Kryptoperidinium foliaceum, Strain CCMP 1326" /LENGTH=75 /DNA_ID=CAMNT_0017571279 /DNA_START=143 /DNA_END=367 /DNA_ORIENTATION=-
MAPCAPCVAISDLRARARPVTYAEIRCAPPPSEEGAVRSAHANSLKARSTTTVGQTNGAWRRPSGSELQPGTTRQ